MFADTIRSFAALGDMAWLGLVIGIVIGLVLFLGAWGSQGRGG
jgi:hypothetical protein